MVTFMLVILLAVCIILFDRINSRKIKKLDGRIKDIERIKQDLGLIERNLTTFVKDLHNDNLKRIQEICPHNKFSFKSIASEVFWGTIEYQKICSVCGKVLKDYENPVEYSRECDEHLKTLRKQELESEREKIDREIAGMKKHIQNPWLAFLDAQSKKHPGRDKKGRFVKK